MRAPKVLRAPAKLYRRSPGEREVSLPPRDYRTAAELLAETAETAGLDVELWEAARRRGRMLRDQPPEPSEPLEPPEPQSGPGPHPPEEGRDGRDGAQRRVAVWRPAAAAVRK
ncbi:hypothetical protein ACFY4C_11800 [Actinomadura viridis]|uniref:hypothetical protein n=1 Tax=Actinomadura viridis TaxID=58110 RepID=UPI00368C8CA9